MELNKPYTENERLNFIVEYNHKKGYKIETRAEKLVALGYTTEEIAQQNEIKRKNEIQKQLEELDKKRIRAVCEPSMKTETQSWLDYYNSEIKNLRLQL